MFQNNSLLLCQLSIAAVSTTLVVCTFDHAASAAILYNPDTQHYYEFVPGSFTWSEAKTQAENRSTQGLKGYLVTITSAAENTFLAEHFMLQNPIPTYLSWGWMGASDAEKEGEWKWVTGPEAGTIFYNISKPSSSTSSSFSQQQAIDNSYTNWSTGEPNDLFGYEDFAHLDYRTNRPAGQWNDANNIRIGYFVEYGGLESVPEPAATVGLLLLGALGVLRRVQYR
jgi:trimeric autotransporter adhesin